jgi:hypothetical protein
MGCGCHDGGVQDEFRPLFGRVLTVSIVALCAASAVVLTVREPADGLRAAPWLALTAGACWALYWRPRITVDDGGVHLVNPLRTIDVPWPAIQGVETRFALSLATSYGSFTGWAAPAPGLRKTLTTGREEAAHLPASTAAADGVIRPGDLPSSASGTAALLIRRRWEELRAQGHLDDPRLERDDAPVTWHRGTIAVGAALVVLCVVSLLV